MSTKDLVLAVFAVWRITTLLLREEGPFEVFIKLRSFIGVKYNAESEPYGETSKARLFACFWCLSMWITFIWMLVLLWAGIYSGNFPHFLLYTFGIAGMSILCEEIIQAI